MRLKLQSLQLEIEHNMWEKIYKRNNNNNDIPTINI